MHHHPHRRPPAVVLWGGRPGLDLQAGSPADRYRAERLRRIAAVTLAAGKAMCAYRTAFVRFGVNAAQASESLRRAGLALDRLDHDARRRPTKA